MTDLFECSSDNVSLYLKNIYEEDELEKDSTTEKFSVVRKEGNCKVTRTLDFMRLPYPLAKLENYTINAVRGLKTLLYCIFLFYKLENECETVQNGGEKICQLESMRTCEYLT
jgi:Virulence protein